MYYYKGDLGVIPFRYDKKLCRIFQLTSEELAGAEHILGTSINTYLAQSGTEARSTPMAFSMSSFLQPSHNSNVESISPSIASTSFTNANKSSISVSNPPVHSESQQPQPPQQQQ